jgi:hypothetical protein
MFCVVLVVLKGILVLLSLNMLVICLHDDQETKSGNNDIIRNITTA